MHIKGKFTFDAPAALIWPLIFEPQSLMKLIPGCEGISEVSSGEYKGIVRIGVAAIAGTFLTHVRLIELHEPDFCHLQGEISGPTGLISGTAIFNLEEVGEQETIFTYEGSALITGALAKLNPRFIEGVGSSLIKQGLVQLSKQIIVDS